MPRPKPSCPELPVYTGSPGLSRSRSPYLLLHPHAGLEGAAQVPVQEFLRPPGPEGPRAWRRCCFTPLSLGQLTLGGDKIVAQMEPGAMEDQPGQATGRSPERVQQGRSRALLSAGEEEEEGREKSGEGTISVSLSVL